MERYIVEFGYVNGFYEVVTSDYTNNGKGFTYREAIRCRDELKEHKNIVWTGIVQVDNNYLKELREQYMEE